MIDYKAIADEAEQYSDYQAAFDVMSLEEKDAFKELSSNNLREWTISNDSDYAILKLEEDVVSEMAIKQLSMSTTFDMRKPEIRGFVSMLPISTIGKNNLTAMAAIKVKVWQGLKPGHVQNALQKRAEGKV